MRYMYKSKKDGSGQIQFVKDVDTTLKWPVEITTDEKGPRSEEIMRIYPKSDIRGDCMDMDEDF